MGARRSAPLLPRRRAWLSRRRPIRGSMPETAAGRGWPDIRDAVHGERAFMDDRDEPAIRRTRSDDLGSGAAPGLWRGLLLALALVCGTGPLGAAQTPLDTVVNAAKTGETTQPTTEELSVEQLRERLAAAEAEQAAISGPERHAAGAPPGASANELQQRARLLQLTVFSYRQNLNAFASLAERKQLAADAEAKRRAWTGFGQKPPYSILLADGLRTALQVKLLNLHSEEGRQKILAAQMENTRERLLKANQHLRLTQETLEAATPADLPLARWRHDLAQLEVRGLGAYLGALAAQVREAEANVAEYNREIEFERGKIGEVEQALAFTANDLERLKADIDERRSRTIADLEVASRDQERLSTALNAAIARQTEADKLLAELQARHGEARKAVAEAEAALNKAEHPDSFLGKLNPFRGSSAKSDLDQRRAALADIEKRLAAAHSAAQQAGREHLLAVERSRNAGHAVESLNIRLVALDLRRSFWDLRYVSFNDERAGKRDRNKDYEDSRRLLKVLNPAVEHLRGKLDIIVGQIAEQNSLLRLGDETAVGAEVPKEILDLLGEREKQYLETFSEVEETRHLLLRWVEEENVLAVDRSAGEVTRGWLESGREWLKAAWNFELFAVEDSIVADGRVISGRRGVTVAKVSEAVLIVLIGYLIFALLTRMVMAKAVHRGRLEATGAHIARKWILAVVLVVLLLFALDIMKIPLTAFAFLGGAIAIGAGFGMQTLLKNLISGVMLLMERPFKPHDIVEVGGISGEVTDINVRSCTIRGFNGIETLVPNSTFLEQNVTNWTLSSSKVRYTLNVGVAYGSPARQVSDLLLEVAARCPNVLMDPAPEVQFMDFADSALLFTLYVWVEIGQGRRGGTAVLSDLRFMVEASFAEHGISLPFPQRDVHLDAAGPLPVRVVAGGQPT